MNSNDYNYGESGAHVTTGRVFLVGAGPGDPELLTRKAERLLRAAEVVLHDELVSPAVLTLAASSATIINVGKRYGTKKITQQQIHALMIEHAQRGRMVVRLKGGDPMLFGRAAEELVALREAGIPVEIVPGITAALAVASSMQFSLTDRNLASHVTIGTGQLSAENASYRGNDRSLSTTYVFYMPGRDYAKLAEDLLSRGFDEDEPCLIVSHVSLPTETSISTTLRELLHCDSLDAPSLVIVGAVTSASSRSIKRNVKRETEQLCRTL